jgi:hypothetical protein
VLEVGTSRWVLEVFDNVELDVPLAQHVQRAPALPSARVIVYKQLFHVRISFPKRMISLADQA